MHIIEGTLRRQRLPQFTPARRIISLSAKKFSITMKRPNSGIQVNIVVQNIRRRWYEVTVSSDGTTIPGPNRFTIGPENRKGAAEVRLNNVPVGLGSSITFFADGRSPKALGMHVLDLVLIAATGKPIPGNLIDAAFQLLEQVQSLSAFGLAVGGHLAQPDVRAILTNLLRLPNLAANDPSLRNALNILGVSTKQLAVLQEKAGNIRALIKLVSIIAKELERLTAPRFDSVTLVAR